MLKQRLASSLGNLSALTEEGLAALLSPTTFAANAVAAFTVASQVGSFIALNDGRPGYQADADALVFLRNTVISTTTPVDFA